MAQISNSAQHAIINVQMLINEHRFTAYQFLIFILCFLIILADGLDTGAIGFIAPSLLQEWGVTRAALSPVLSAALFGMAVGALTAGPLADRFGRKLVIVLSVFFFGFGCLFSALSQNIEQLVILRFFTGMGLGAAMPNTATLLAEYAPHRWRVTLINAIFCAFPLGIAIGGGIASVVIPALGWQSVLVIGGIFPLILGGVLLFLLPESVQYLLIRQHATQRITTILNRVLKLRLSAQQRFVLNQQQSDGKSALALIVSKAFLPTTIMLWITCFMSLLVFYLLTSWLPTILHETGLSIREASLMTAFFPFGGTLGTLLIGWFMDKKEANSTLFWSYLLAGILLLLTGLTYGGPMPLFALSLLLAGAMVGGAQSAIPALTAAYYPPQGRATGVSWMHGIGRLGAILGAFIGAYFLSFGFSFNIIFALLAVPMFIAGLALWGKGQMAKSIGDEK